MKKRILSILLTVCMVLTMLPGYAMGAFTAGDLITVQINGTYNSGINTIGDDGTQYVGASLSNAISKHAGGIDSIKQLKITAGKVTTEDWQYIRELSEMTFSGMTNFKMTNFEIDAAVTAVADIPDRTTYGVFGLFPTSVQSVKVPQEITVGDSAFAYCENLTKAYFPLVTKIESYAFFSCKALERAEFPEAVTIGQYAFDECNKLTSVSLDKATKIDEEAFAFCENLATASLPSAETIGPNIFMDCNNLETVSLPNVKTISDVAFQNCTALTTLKLGAIPPTVGIDAFIDVPKTNPLVFLNPDGTELTGVGVTTAQTAYKAVSDQDTSDNLWYGWEITGDSTPTEDSAHKHCLCGGTNNVGDHTSHTSVGFKEWNTNNAMPTEAGNYYLNTDVTLSSQWVVNANIGLCLNGHTIKITANSGSVVSVENGTLNLCDCNTPTSSGAITGGSGTSGDNHSDFSTADYNGNGVYVSSNGTFNMYGGKINGNTANYQGGGVMNEGNFTMYGGSITDNTILGGDEDGDGGGVYNTGTFTIYDGTISNNKAPFYGGGVYNEKTFTMNGGIIRGNQSGDRTSSTNNRGGGGIANFGTFTMNNGEISSNQAMYEGGGVYNKGTFNMENGKISTNTVNGSSPDGCFGGGVANEKSFTMDGGEIGSNKAIGGASSNGTNSAVGGGVYNKGTFVMGGTSSIISNTAGSSKSAQGGGIFNQGSLSMKGGKITNNSVTGTTNTAGGGVYDQNGWSYISGAPVIINNLANNVKSNWLIFYTNPFQFAEPLTAGASIGVSMGYSISDEYSSFFTDVYNTQNGNVDPAICFSSDDPKYHVELIKNKAKLVLGPAATAAKIIIQGLNTAKVGSPYSQEILTNYNGTGTMTYSATGLPSGLSINASTGMITGTPAVSADTGSPYSVTIKVSDGTTSDSKTFSMTVDVSDANKTYTVTFNENGGSGAMPVQSFNATTPQNLTLNAFTRSGYTFIGWNTMKEGTGDSYNDGASYTAATNATLYAQWQEITYTVSGMVKDKDDKKVSGAEVKLMKGNLQIGATVTTDENGVFIITNVPNGTYNLVVSKDDIIVTSIITVSNSNYLAGTITLPAGKTNSVVEVKGSQTPKIVVGNLDGQFANTVQHDELGVTAPDMAVVTSGGAIVIKFVAEKKDNTAANANDIISTAGTNNKTVGIFIDLSVLKTVTNTTGGAISASLIGLNELIDVLIPLDEALQNKTDYIVYRYHEGSVESITTTANEDGEKIELIDNSTTIKLTINKFSTYAIAYTSGTQPAPDLSSDWPSLPTINVVKSKGGEVAISTDKKTATINPDDGYVIGDVIVDGKSVGSVEEYTFADSKNHTINVVFVKDTALPYYLQNDEKIYIGFSVIAGRSYKYIAPEGVTVEYKDNPKIFKDNTIEWAKPSIDFVTERELFLGTSQSIFSPNINMTRAMFVTVMGRLYERSYGIESATSTFTDVDGNAYYAKYVAWANENGVIKGIGNNKFAPYENVTREQMAVIMFNFTQLLNKAGVTENPLAYTDSASISSWAIEGAKYCQETNIIIGRNGGNFAPQESATRAEVAAVVERFIKTIMK